MQFAVTTQPLPTPWVDQDVGYVIGLTGSATYSSGVFTVKGAGNGIFGAADAFHYLYTPLTGDGSIIARVTNCKHLLPCKPGNDRET